MIAYEFLFRWERADYTSECSKPCEGERQIFYHCILIDYNQSKKVVHDNHCMDLTKPPRIEKCNGQCEAPTIPQWTTGNWSAVSIKIDPIHSKHFIFSKNFS